MGRWFAALLSVLGAFACAGTPDARYPSWEPTSTLVPAVRDRRAALGDLERSLNTWRARGLRTYSYVRARQVSKREVRFTLIVVEADRVTRRALLSTSPDEDGLGDRRSGKAGAAPNLLWLERDGSVGAHSDGERALTVEQLYALCRDEVLSAPGNARARLSFHRDGLLQHCGFDRADCAECATASIQSLGRYTPWQQPNDVLCTDRYGLFVAGQPSLGAWDCEMCRCEADHDEDPRASLQTPRLLPRLTPEQRELCAVGAAECPEEAPELLDICRLDPAACPRLDRPRRGASWSCMMLLRADCDGPGYHPEPACIAYPRPGEVSEAWKRRCSKR